MSALAYALLRPLLFRLDPETGHGLTLRLLRSGLVPRAAGAADPILASELWGRRLANPIGLAAGFDKNAEAVAPLLRLGFGLVEVGSVTPRPQPGNPRPRLFRLAEDRAVINRMGFNNRGLEAAAAALTAFRARGPAAGLVGVNLGKNKDSPEAAPDYVAGARRLAAYADYLVVNVSSPNTPGLRALQDRAALTGLLAAVRAALAEAEAPPPLLLKIAPDLTEADRRDIAAVALDSGLDGLIVSNTTVERPAGLRSRWKGEAGGLSGRPLFEPSTRLLGEMYRLTGGRLPLIGVGGVESGATAYAKIRAGASLVQLYSALVYEGPALVGRIAAELAALLRRDGFASLTEAVGADQRPAPAA
ncbi:MAG: quinone-dependent dihydroorotate dehydrogenase [Tistlia sp.]|uniref:quinone-dependent dihydroorotate dehydrogenase n=1 Tax=Tistlia sp. TaxID=3057121 RepID=UPI0034A44B3B